MILLDTNILVRHANPADPANPIVMRAIGALHAAAELCIVPQNLYELWSTATRPLQANGLDMDPAACGSLIDDFKQLFRLLPDRPALYAEWEALVRAYQCRGRVAYDARIVAAMKTYGIARLLTFNGGDFARYPGIVVLDPASFVPPVSGTNP